ncbi:hypothetical protein GCM10027059_29850 [Myceligenerans halotolerans]
MRTHGSIDPKRMQSAPTIIIVLPGWRIRRRAVGRDALDVEDMKSIVGQIPGNEVPWRPANRTV